MTRTRRPALEALATRAGILPSYVDNAGAERRIRPDTCVALLHAMGLDASDDAHAGASLRALEAADRARVIDPVQVVRGDRPQRPTITLLSPDASDGPFDWQAIVEAEDGASQPFEGRIERRAAASGGAVTLDAPLSPGYYTIRVTVDGAGTRRTGIQTLVVAPRRCVEPHEIVGRRRAFGLLANLYSVRSGENWGVGDLGDLRRLAAWARSIGAAFVGINPLHAVRLTDQDVSPYSPVSRFYRNLAYLDIAAVPELPESPEAQELLAAPGFREQLAQARAAVRVDYARVADLKRRIVAPLHRVFQARHGDGRTDRGAAYRRYLEREGESLERYATFVVLDALLRAQGQSGDPRRWPELYRDPGSSAVTAVREAHSALVDRERYIQFELDRQLALAAGADLALGIYQDLAVSSSPSGCDVWAWPDLFAPGVSIGAPPDAYARGGQNWWLPALDPHRLRADGYRYWVRLLRSALAHSGALRIDHVMGLFRLFWIPDGRPAAEGAYVRYPAAELLAILALESRRHRAVIIGEDLGTVPPETRPAMAAHGMLSSALLYFTQDENGAFLPAASYQRNALVTVGSHDHAPLAGFWSGRDLNIRRSVGLLTEIDAEREQVERARQRAALLQRLAQEGAWDGGAQEPSYGELVRAVHAFLSRSPSALFGAALDDITGETEPVNVPGVGLDRYPNWSRRMRLDLDALDRDPVARAALEPLAERASTASSAYPRPADGSAGSPR